MNTLTRIAWALVRPLVQRLPKAKRPYTRHVYETISRDEPEIEANADGAYGRSELDNHREDAAVYVEAQAPDVTLFVDAVNGSDDNDGLTPDTARATLPPEAWHRAQDDPPASTNSFSGGLWAPRGTVNVRDYDGRTFHFCAECGMNIAMGHYGNCSHWGDEDDESPAD